MSHRKRFNYIMTDTRFISLIKRIAWHYVLFSAVGCVCWRTADYITNFDSNLFYFIY